MNKEKAHELYDQLMKARKSQYTYSEMVIILTSQYYNIIDLDKLILELDPIEYNIENMRKELLSICESFQKNLNSIDENFSWDKKNEQIYSVEMVKKSCIKFLIK
jgi:hypothetical protein